MDHYKRINSARWFCLDRYPLVIASRYNIPYLLDVPGRGEFVVGEIYAIDDEKVCSTIVAVERCEMAQYAVAHVPNFQDSIINSFLQFF